MYARSVEEIPCLYPELTIVPERPEWMTPERHAELVEQSYDIDGAPSGVLNVVLTDRPAA